MTIHPPRILIVEDDMFYANIYQTKLNQEGYEVALARNGGEGLAEARKRHPDLILLDIIMPVKDGFATLAELRSDAKLRNIPVVIMSNLGQPQDIERAKGLGARDFLVKAKVTLDEMVAKVKEFLKS